MNSKEFKLAKEVFCCTCTWRLHRMVSKCKYCQLIALLKEEANKPTKVQHDEEKIFPRTWTKTQMIVWLRRVAHRLGHLPNRDEIELFTSQHAHAPQVNLFYRKFGSLADAYRAAGLLKGDK